MRLNRYIPDSQIPTILKGQLIFGDKKQLDALNDLEMTINQIEAEKINDRINPPKYYDVTIEYSGTTTLRVLAHNRKEAESNAEDDFDLYDAETIIDDISSEKIATPFIKR